MLMSVYDWIINTVQNGFDNTFGQMNGKEVLWTILAILAVYQLVMIKWRLIDQNRHNHVPNSFLSGQRRIYGSVLNRRRSRSDFDPTPEPIMDTMMPGTPVVASQNQNDNPFGTAQHNDETILVGTKTHKSNSQAGLQSWKSSPSMSGSEGNGPRTHISGTSDGFVPAQFPHIDPNDPDRIN